MIFYFTGATLVFGVLMNAFIKDPTTAKTDIGSWAVLTVGTLLWPLVLLSMLRKQLRKSDQLDPKYLH